MRESGPSIRYLGFASGPEGVRQLDFSIDSPNQQPVTLRFDVPYMLFTGENRILPQEAAGICYAKLKDLVGRDSAVSGRVLLTDTDIYQYRQLPAPRHRTSKHRPS